MFKPKTRIERLKLQDTWLKSHLSDSQRTVEKRRAHQFNLKKATMKSNPKYKHHGSGKQAFTIKKANDFNHQKAELIIKKSIRNPSHNMSSQRNQISLNRARREDTQQTNYKPKLTRKERKISSNVIKNQAQEKRYQQKELNASKDVNIVQIFFSNRYKVGSENTILKISKNRIKNPVKTFNINEAGAWHAYSKAKKRVMNLINKYIDKDDKSNIILESCLSNLINSFYLDNNLLTEKFISGNQTNLRVNIGYISTMDNDDWPTMKDLSNYTEMRIKTSANKKHHPLFRKRKTLYRFRPQLTVNCLKTIAKALHHADMYRGRTTNVSTTMAKQILTYNYGEF